MKLFVPGEPAPKGSTRAFVIGGRAVTTNANKNTKPWEAQVAFFVREHIGTEVMFPKPGAVRLELLFIMRRPSGEPKRMTRDHTRKPDLDKLCRAVIDALTGLVYTDDAQIINLMAFKRTAELIDQTGVWITAQ